MGERLAFTFALTGRRFGFYVTQGVALGYELAGLSARTGPPVCPELVAPAPLSGANPAPERPGNSLIRLIRCYAV